MPIANLPYLGAISLLLKDQINDRVADLQNTEALTDIAALGGRYVVSDQWNYHTYVNQDHFILPTISAITTNTASTIVVTFSVGTSGYIRISDQVKFANGKTGLVQIVTTAASQDTATIKMVDNVAITVAVNDKLGIMGRARGSKRGAASTLTYPMTKYENVIQSFDEGYEIDNVAQSSRLRVPFRGQDYIVVRDHWVTATKHKAEVNATMIGGTLGVTRHTDASPVLTDPQALTAVQTTRGLDQYIATYGVVNTVAALDTYALADLADSINKLIAKKADITSYMGLCSTAVRMKMDNTFKNLGSSGITSGRLNIGGRDVDMEVEKLMYGGMELDLKTMPLFNHPAILSQTTIVKSLYFVPKGLCKTEGGGMQERFRMRYVPHNIKSNLGNEIWAEWYTGANAPTGPTSDTTTWMTNWMTNQGLEIIGAEHFAAQRVLT